MSSRASLVSWRQDLSKFGKVGPYRATRVLEKSLWRATEMIGLWLPLESYRHRSGVNCSKALAESRSGSQHLQR